MSSEASSKSSAFVLPVFYAAIIHIAAACVMFISWNFTSNNPKLFEIPKHIKANVVTVEKAKVQAKPKPITKPKPVVKPKPEVKPKPKPKPEVKPKPEPKVAPVQVAKETIEPLVQEIEPEVVTSEEIPVVETPPVEVPVEEEASEEELLQELLAGIEAEEIDISEQLEDIAMNEVKRQALEAEIADYIVAITIQIEQQWSRPVEIRLLDLRNVEATVLVEILPTGELQSRAITKSSGIPNYDQSVLRAIDKVRRFNVPKNSEAFEVGGFRRLNLTFRPEDLM